MESNTSSPMAQVPYLSSFTLTFILKIKVLAFFSCLGISRKQWKIEQTLLLPSDRKSCICHRKVPLQMLYIVTLTYIFKGTNLFIVNISLYQRISQTAIDIRKLPTNFQSGVIVENARLTSPKILLPFPPFPGGAENTYRQFSRKLFN